MSEQNKLIKLSPSKLQSLKDKLNELTNKNTGGGISFDKSKITEYCILMDVSGSMGECLKNGKYFYEEMIEAVQNLVKNYDFDLFAFSTHCEKIEKQKLKYLCPIAGTNLGGAFQYVKNYGKKKIILLTDGEPDYEFEALHESKGLQLEIIFIGNPPEPLFLRKLAKQSGGSFSVVDLNTQNLLESKIRGLLT